MATLNATFELTEAYVRRMRIVMKSTEEATDKILKASGATTQLNEKLENTGAAANAASSGVKMFSGMGKVLDIVKKGMDITDSFTNANVGLGLVNDGLQTQLELQDKIFAAANRSRISYVDMASAVSRLQLQAGDAFKSNNEAIAFTELMQKSLQLGGADKSEQNATMLQMSQVMASGALVGEGFASTSEGEDGFTSISKNAPIILEAISKYTGKSIDELRILASEGGIAADIIKNSMFAMSDDINIKFDGMEMTFAQVWNNMSNDALQAFGKIMEKISELINTEGFKDLVDGIIIGVNLLSFMINGLIDMIIDAWPIIEPILIAIGTFLLFQLIGYLSSAIPLLATLAASWMLMNIPLIMTIASIAGIIYMVQSMGVKFEDIFAAIGNIVGGTIAVIRNTFFGLADIVLAVLEKIASAMDFVFGSNSAGLIAGWRNNLKDMADAAAAKKAPNDNFQNIISNIIDTDPFSKNRYDKFGGFGTNGNPLVIEGKGGKVNDKFEGFGTNSNPLVVEGKGGKVKVDMSNEDLKYLRDIAEREYISKFSTATLAPNIAVSFGDVYETADADRVAERIQKILKEQIAMTAEGV